jgi:UDP-N-acetylmuramoylalanine-D-glutamate ligase
MMRVLVCGGRDYNDFDTVYDYLKVLVTHQLEPVTIIHGAARGADSLAALAAERLGFDTEQYPANWSKHGRAAGPIRNKQMLDSGLDLVIAFPGGRGTANMITQARKAGVEVWTV